MLKELLFITIFSLYGYKKTAFLMIPDHKFMYTKTHYYGADPFYEPRPYHHHRRRFLPLLGAAGLGLVAGSIIGKNLAAKEENNQIVKDEAFEDADEDIWIP